MNKKSTQKEPQLWPSELRRQGIFSSLLGALQRHTLGAQQATLRAKKAVACLLFVSGRPMTDIETTLTQFGGASGGAAGSVRGVANRTSDLLPTAARVAEILHPALDLQDRVNRLTIRLTYGILGVAVDLAREAGNALLRGDYCRLANEGLCEPEAIGVAEESKLLECVDGDRRKLTALRDAALRVAGLRFKAKPQAEPILDQYVA